MKIFNIAFIGAGRITAHHINLLGKSRTLFKIVAICDLDLKKARKLSLKFKKLNIKIFSNYHEMFKTCKIDVAAIMTPSGMHYEHAKDIINKYKKNIILEKPPALKIKHLEELYKLAKKNRTNIFPIFQNRYNKAVQFLKKSIQNKELGKINICSVRVRWCRPQRYYDMSEWRGTFSQDGGALTNQGIHHLDLLRYLNGEIKSINCKMKTLGVKIEVEDTAVAHIEFKNGSVGTLEITTSARPNDFEASISLLGSKGAAQLGGIAVNKLEIYTPNSKLCKKNSENFPIVYGYGHLEVYKRVYNFLIKKNDLNVTKQDAIGTLELLHAFYLSNEIGKKIILGNKKQSKNLGKESKKISQLYRTKSI